MRTASLASLKLLLSLAAILASAPAHAQAPACGTTLYTSVTLTADLVCGRGEDGLIVGDHRVRIDLNGYSIVGPFSDSDNSTFAKGISSSGFEQVQIVGPGLITGFLTPIEIEGGNDHLISEVAAVQERGSPVLLLNASRAVIQNSRITRLRIASDPGHFAAMNRVIDNDIGADPASSYGYFLLEGCGTTDNLVAYNRLAAESPMYLYYGADANQVIKNRMERAPITLHGASNNLIEGNDFRNDSGTFTSVEIESSQWPVACAGGKFLPGDNNIVRGNQMHSGAFGIWIDGSPGVTSLANQVTGNTFSDQAYAALGFGYDASENDARRNVYVNVRIIAVDYGSGNLWP